MRIKQVLQSGKITPKQFALTATAALTFSGLAVGFWREGKGKIAKNPTEMTPSNSLAENSTQGITSKRN